MYKLQSGVALVVALIMLGLLAIIGVAAVKLSTTHFRVVGNLQAENETKMALQSKVESYIGDPTSFFPPNGPSRSSITVNGHAVIVDIGLPRCVASLTPPDSSIQNPSASAVFEICAKAQDTVTGANMTYRWGVNVPFAKCNPPFDVNPCLNL